MKGIIMENQENNMSELDQLKAQYETLKQQFDQQEIVNDRLIKSATQTDVDFFAKYRKTALIAYPILAVLGFAYYAYLGQWAFAISFFLLLAVMIVVEMWLTRNTRRQVMENADLLTLSKNMQKLKTGYAIYTTLILIAGLMFVTAVTLNKIVSLRLYGPQIKEAIWSLGFAMVLMLGFAILAYRSFVGHCNNVLRQIDAMNSDHPVRNNRPFWCFLCAVTLLCTISGLLFYNAIDSVVYTRADNDLSSEGKLGIWEIYADTNVFEKDVALCMEQWQQGDSIVLMTGKSGMVTKDIEETTGLSCNEGKGQLVKLYALKETTSEGPVISSAVLDGKPIIKRIEHGPYRNRKPERLGVFVNMTPEASQLWLDFTQKAEESEAPCRAALCLDGMVYQEWAVVGAISTGAFFVTSIWTKDEVEAFCKRLIKQ